MLATLLQTIETAFGSALSPAGDIAFWLGVLMVLYVIGVPLIRVGIDMQAANLGLEREWIMQCLACRRVTVVTGNDCEHCGKSLDIPWSVRLRNLFGAEGEPSWLRSARWYLTITGVVLFATFTLIVLIASGAWKPQSNVERLFVGLSLIAWAGLGWLLGRILGIGTGGPISRVRDAVFALATLAVLATTTTIAGAARPEPESIVARVKVNGLVGQYEGRSVPLNGPQFGVEFLQIDHDLAGIHRVIPLAVIGAQRIDIPHGKVSQAMIDYLWEHAQSYARHGLQVRKRIEQFPAAEPGIYDVVLRGSEVQVRSYLDPTG